MRRTCCSRCGLSPPVVPVVRTGLHCGGDGAFGADLGGGRVVPVVRTGLHCGLSPWVTAAGGLVSRPRRQDGAPLRPRGSRRRRQGGSRRPRRQDGAPLRHQRAGTAAHVARRRPRRQDGAPLRPSLTLVSSPSTGGRPRRQDGAPLRPRDLVDCVMPCLRSSPSSGRGSIAAMIDADLREVHRRSSPLSGRGSIAAPTWAPCWPAAATSSPSSGRGSIAALVSRMPETIVVGVVPVVRTGLHCGFNSPPHAQGSARRPRRQDGAPLRPSVKDAHGRVVGPVVPVVRTGLHCGLHDDHAMTTPSASSPSSGRGSIAASPSP